MKYNHPRSNLKKRKTKRMSSFAKYFTLEELLTSATARQKSIENLPSWEVVEHLKELAAFLDQLREDWGSGIVVSSGFRCAKLNKAVGGVNQSLHMAGYAADIVPSNGKMKEFCAFIEKWAKDKFFDQIIIESKKTTKWVHVSLFNNSHKQRKMVFLMDVK